MAAAVVNLRQLRPHALGSISPPTVASPRSSMPLDGRLPRGTSSIPVAPTPSRAHTPDLDPAEVGEAAAAIEGNVVREKGRVRVA
jgi:hypothetical protein